jgi:Zn-dependent peptidase ImmA (M78 family)
LSGYGILEAQLASAVSEGLARAREVRRRLSIAPQQPIDPFWVAEQLNIVVVRKPLNERLISGAYLYWPASDMGFILINATDVQLRQRFTLAHEIGHSQFEPKCTVVDDGGANDDPAVRTAEKRANAFAAELLLPEKAASQWQPKAPWGESPLDVAELALQYGISYEATLWRLKSIGHLDNARVADLKERVSELPDEPRRRLSARTDERLELPRDFAQLAREAVAEGFISRKRYDELTRERNEPFIE